MCIMYEENEKTKPLCFPGEVRNLKVEEIIWFVEEFEKSMKERDEARKMKATQDSSESVVTILDSENWA